MYKYYGLSFTILLLLALSITASAVPPGFVCISGDQFMLGNTIYKLKGSNYYPKNHMWQYMWDHTYPISEVESEADMMSGAGINCVRILVPYSIGGWGGANVSASRLSKLEQIVNVFGNRGIRVCLTLFDWETTYPAPNTSTEANHYQYLTTIVNRFKDNRFIFMWDLKNEPDHPDTFSNIVANGDNWDYDPVTRDKVISWLSRMVARVKQLDPNHPATVGMRCDVNTVDILGFSDIAIFHAYNHVFASGSISNLNNYTTKPVLVQEFGWPSWSVRGGDFNETYMTTFYQAVLSAIESNKIAGGLQWMAFDEIVYNNPSYPQQECYGLWRYDYSPKPALSVFQNTFQVQKFPVEIDLTPPAAPSNFTSTSGDTQVALSWKTPSDADFKGIVIRYSTSGYPATAQAGSLLYQDETTPANTSATCVHSGLQNGTTYYYSIFAYDKPMDNHSTAASASAKPADGVSTHDCISARTAPNGTSVTLGRKVITAVFGTYMYITEPNRLGGIRVNCSTSGYVVGDLVTVTGTAQTITSYSKNVERYIAATNIVKASPTPGIDPVKSTRPLYISARSVGGSKPDYDIIQVPSPQGPYNVGMLVKLSGKIKTVSGTRIVIDDGSGSAYYVVVTCPGSYTLPTGDFVTLTGISIGDLSPDKVNARRSILLRDWNDLKLVKSSTGTAKITGRVTATDGSSIANTTISLQPGSLSTSTDSDGAYSLTALSAGAYTLKAEAPGKVYYKSTVSLTSTQQRTLDIQLGPSSGYPLNPGFESFSVGLPTGWTVYSCTNPALFAGEAVKPNTDWGLPAPTFSRDTLVKHTGNSALSIYSEWGVHYGAVYQQIPATIGVPYTFTAWTWRHDQWGGGNECTWVGIDPTGGTNVHSTSVVWSPMKTDYETWSSQTITATSQSNTITVYIKSIGLYAGNLMKTVADDATLEAWK